MTPAHVARPAASPVRSAAAPARCTCPHEGEALCGIWPNPGQVTATLLALGLRRSLAAELLLREEPLELRAELIGGRHVLRLVSEQPRPFRFERVVRLPQSPDTLGHSARTFALPANLGVSGLRGLAPRL